MPDASYPLYCLHGTVILLALAAARREPALATALGFGATIFTFLVALGFAWLAEPHLRHALSRVLTKSPRDDLREA